MRKTSFITLAAIVLLLVAGAVGVYAYDSSRSDQIADGVSIGGVDVGGMSAEEARQALSKDLVAPLKQPVKVEAAGSTFKLSPKQARVRADIDGMVADAVAASREGDIVSRTVRDVTGSSKTAELPAHVSYSKRAVADLVDRVKSDVDRPAQDASVEPAGNRLEPVAARKGVQVQADGLKREVAAALQLAGGERKLEAETKTVKPDVTTAEVAEKYPTYITVDRDAFQLRFYKRLKLAETYKIAVGRVGFDTPAGLYHIQNKAVDPAWSVPEWGGALAGKTIPGGAPDNPLKSRWLGIYDGAGIHGTDDVGSLGTAASHGCIRMAIPEVERLYDEVPLNTPIYIS